MDAAAKDLWELLKNGGALFMCGIALYVIYRGGFITRLHHEEVVRSKDEALAAKDREIEQLRRDFNEQLEREQENGNGWKQIAAHTTGWGRAVVDLQVQAAKSLPPTTEGS